MKQQIHQLILVSRTKRTASPKNEFPSLFTRTWTSHVRACVLDCSKHQHFNWAETEATTTVRQLQSRRLAHIKVLSLFLSIHWVNVQYVLVILRLQDRPRRPRVEESELHRQLVCSLAVFSPPYRVFLVSSSSSSTLGCQSVDDTNSFTLDHSRVVAVLV